MPMGACGFVGLARAFVHSFIRSFVRSGTARTDIASVATRISLNYVCVCRLHGADDVHECGVFAARNG